MAAINGSKSASSAIAGRLKSLVPGIGLSVAITVVSLALQRLEEHFFSHPYLEALVIAILIGIAVRSIWEPDKRFRSGIAFSAKQASRTGGGAAGRHYLIFDDRCFGAELDLRDRDHGWYRPLRQLWH
jgi:Predicted membrane protein